MSPQSYLPSPVPTNSKQRETNKKAQNTQEERETSLITWCDTKKSDINRVNPEPCTCIPWQGMETHYLKCKCQPCRWQWQNSKLFFYSSKYYKYVKIFPQQAIFAYWNLISLLVQRREFWSMFLTLTGRNHSHNKDASCNCSRCLHCIISIQMNSAPAESPCILSE